MYSKFFVSKVSTQGAFKVVTCKSKISEELFWDFLECKAKCISSHEDSSFKNIFKEAKKMVLESKKPVEILGVSFQIL